ncbi:MAG: 6,7-dimethyl-8-ribityllumazine synthase [Chloroflexi bacterium]|nr:6,7-dimethyl-8-ribityllumazine synthase [Chloroflexota bacterium]
MAKHYQGSPDGAGLAVGIVVSRYNEIVTRKLLDGALETLAQHGVRQDDIHIAWTPGAFEIPQAARQMARSLAVNAVICLGCVIRGETPHFDHISRSCVDGVDGVAREMMVPMALGVLTTDNLEQAIERAGGSVGNKGSEAALAALEMANLYRAMRGR